MAVPKLRPRRAQLPKLLPSDDKIYSTRRWSELARSIKRQRPICEHCGEAVAEECHHIMTLLQAPHLAFEPSNIASLCRSCHHDIHKGRVTLERKPRGDEPRVLLG